MHCPAYRPTVYWRGYVFRIGDPSQVTWRRAGGVYVFAYQTEPNVWKPLYVGETGNFRERMWDHERWADAVRLGATHVVAIRLPTEEIRLWMELELIREFDPPLNVQGRR